MRALARSIFLDLVGNLRKPARGVHILNGHFLTATDALDRRGFEMLLGRLRNFAEFLPIETASALVSTDECSKFDGVGLAFTFDDGFLDCYTGIAPALNSFNTNACFFVNPGFIEGDAAYRKRFVDDVVRTPGKEPMTWGQVRELHANGFIIGNHTVDHYRLNSVDQGAIREQIREGKRRIAKEICDDVSYFAWPYGQLDDINEEALRVACSEHRYIFSGADFRHYRAFDGRVLNRRHFEADWKLSHMRYFLSFKKS